MDTKYVKYLIVGAGPGGLQLGYFLQSACLDYLIVEKSGQPGAFFKVHPVHRRLISINKKYNYFEEEEFNWRHDWNSLLSEDAGLRFTQYTDELFPSAEVLLQYLADYAKKNQLNIAYNSEVGKIKRAGEGFSVLTSKGDTLTCDVLIIATGSVNGMVPEDIEGIEYAIPYSEQTLDLDFYRNKRVGVLGGGNSAFETADYLAGTAAYVHILAKHPLKMAWDTHFVGDLRAINNSVIDMYQLKSLHAVLNPRIHKIEKLANGCLMTRHSYDYPQANPPGTLELTREYDVIINCTGFRWIDLDMFDGDLKPNTKTNGKYPLLNETWEVENVPHMYFAGGAMQAVDRKSASGFIHGFRYNVRSLSRLLRHRYENVSLSVSEPVDFHLEAFLEGFYSRCSVTAALFQLYGFLGDLFIFSEDCKSYEEFRELPVAYIQKMLPQDRHVLQLTLEFGFQHYEGTALQFLGPSDPTNTPCAAFLHPVMRHWHKGQMDEFHLGDSLLGRWDMPHRRGGAVMSYHRDCQQWLKRVLKLDVDLPEFPDNNSFRPWTEEEIRAWHDGEMQKPMMPKPCGNASMSAH